MDEEPKRREIRRYVGYLATRLAEMPLGKVNDPRAGRILWPIRTLLTAVLVGLAAGCKGLGEVEELTDWLGSGARHYLALRKRVPDTTMRDLLVQFPADEVRRLNYGFIRRARRRKQLKPDFPLRVVALDGKATSTRLFDPPDALVKYGQQQGDHALVRTITSCFITVPGRPCLDAHPVPPQTNEMGAFLPATDALLNAYGHNLFDVVFYDSGACSRANADGVIARDLDYGFSLKDNQPELLKEAKRLLGHLPLDTAQATTSDIDGGDIATWWGWTTGEMAGWNQWSHLKTVVRVHKVTTDKDGNVKSVDDRYYVFSIEQTRLTPKQWLELIRRRWSVENQNHNNFDSVFREDERPWILRPSGMVVVILLRRLAYNLVALLRCVTLRSEQNRSVTWLKLLRRLDRALAKATREIIKGVRRRDFADS
jgi:hypothetical protein